MNIDRFAHFARTRLWAPWGRLVELNHGLVFVEPCYYIRPVLTEHSTVLDCGTGSDANFARELIDRFGVRAIGVDPTVKHRAGLEALEHRTGGRFTLLPVALAGVGGEVAFFQSESNESGSIYQDHANVMRDRITTYNVEALSLDQLLESVGQVDLLKLDIEGAEYAVLDATRDDLIERIPQIVVEFHHGILKRSSGADTVRRIARFRELGYRWHTRDFVNYLFFKMNLRARDAMASQAGRMAEA